jgi:hypothetical protein
MVHYWEDGELIGTTDLLGEAQAWILDDDIDGFITDNQNRTGYRYNEEIAKKEKN